MAYVASCNFGTSAHFILARMPRRVSALGLGYVYVAIVQIAFLQRSFVPLRCFLSLPFSRHDASSQCSISHLCCGCAGIIIDGHCRKMCASGTGKKLVAEAALRVTDGTGEVSLNAGHSSSNIHLPFILLRLLPILADMRSGGCSSCLPLMRRGLARLLNGPYTVHSWPCTCPIVPIRLGSVTFSRHDGTATSQHLQELLTAPAIFRRISMFVDHHRDC